MDKTGERPIVIGAGGAAGHAPECTMASFEAAVGLQVDAVHFGIQFTTDGHPVVCRHETLRETAGVPVRLSDYSAAALAGFDIGFLHGDEYRGQRLPLLTEVAAVLPSCVMLYIEILEFAAVTDDRLDRLGEVLRRNVGPERVVFVSAIEERLVDLKKRLPGPALGLLLTEKVRVPADAVRRADYIGCSCVIAEPALLARDLVEVCHRHRMKAIALNVDDERTMRRLVADGVDGVSSAHPERLRSLETARSERMTAASSRTDSPGARP